MRATTLRPHVQEQQSRRPLVFSASAHVLLLAVVTAGSTLCQPGLTLEAGSGGVSGGGGSVFPVHLSGELTGGAGNVAPSLTPAPAAVKPKQRPEAAPGEAVKLPRFDDPNKDVRKESTEAPAPPQPEFSPDPAPGAIPGEPRPGVGGHAAPGAGGLRIGSGPGGPGVASWYVRQLEQRIARSWLQASLAGVEGPVLTRISFTISRGGRIENIQVLESSGYPGVDRAAERAVRASSPLPPLPVELRARRVEFVAYFEYPPG